MVAKPAATIKKREQADAILAEMDEALQFDPEQAAKELKAILKTMRDKSQRVPFPVDAFPKPIQDILQAFNACYKYPIDYYAISMMSAASVAIGNAYCARYQYKWEAVPEMWGVIVGRSGIAKSKVMKAMIEPLIAIQDKYNGEFAVQMQLYRDRQAQARDKVITEDEVGEEPKRERIVGKKTTMEALQKLLSNNPRGVVIVRDELSGWIKSMNQYRAGDDQETWLEIWDNEDIMVDTLSREIFVKRAFVNIIGGIQPGVIETLAADNRAENGFLARLLFAYPDSLDKPHPSRETIDPDVYDTYARIIKNLHYLPVDIKEPINPHDQKEVRPIPQLLNDEARELYYKFLCDSTDMQNASDDELTKAILAKLDTYCLRFCCLLHLLDIACDELQVHSKEDMLQLKIKPQTVLNAIKLVNYFRYTADRVCQRLESPIKRLAPELQEFYTKGLPEQFKTGEALALAEKVGISARTIERHLIGNKDLLKPLGRGVYEKKF